MLAWLRCPPCSAMNTVSTTSLDWTPPPRGWRHRQRGAVRVQGRHAFRRGFAGD